MSRFGEWAVDILQECILVLVAIKGLMSVIGTECMCYENVVHY